MNCAASVWPLHSVHTFAAAVQLQQGVGADGRQSAAPAQRRQLGAGVALEACELELLHQQWKRVGMQCQCATALQVAVTITNLGSCFVLCCVFSVLPVGAACDAACEGVFADLDVDEGGGLVVGAASSRASCPKGVHRSTRPGEALRRQPQSRRPCRAARAPVRLQCRRRRHHIGHLQLPGAASHHSLWGLDAVLHSHNSFRNVTAGHACLYSSSPAASSGHLLRVQRPHYACAQPT